MPTTLVGIPMDAGTVLREVQFPEGVPPDGESLGTAVTSPLFNHLRTWESGKVEVVTPRGFEPLSPG